MNPSRTIEFSLVGLNDPKGAGFDETDDSTREARTTQLLKNDQSLCWMCGVVGCKSGYVVCMSGFEVGLSVCRGCIRSGGVQISVIGGYGGGIDFMAETHGNETIRRLK